MDRYYYYAGYNYNGASHRGYFCEDNVYTSSSTRLKPAKVEAEHAPANYKVHTSKAGTVYDGPATTYSTMGSVGAESIKLIRTEGNFNYIEYTVSGSSKLKRGFLAYDKISGDWGTLSYNARNQLKDRYFFIRNKNSNKYLDVKSWNTAQGTIVHQWNYHGDSNQLFYVEYDSTNKWYTIEAQNSDKLLSIASGSTHPDRRLCIETNNSSSRQHFWIVKNNETPISYKIVPVSSYGTMCLTDRTVTDDDTYVNQYYTNTTGNGTDVWYFDSYVNISSSATEYETYDRNAAWYYAANNAELPIENNRFSPDCTNFTSMCLQNGGMEEISHLTDRENYNYWYDDILTSRSWTYSPLFSKHWGMASDGVGNMEGKMRSYKMLEFAGYQGVLDNFDLLCDQLNCGDIIQLKYHDTNEAYHNMFVYSIGSTIEYAQHNSNKIADLVEYLTDNINYPEKVTFYIITP